MTRPITSASNLHRRIACPRSAQLEAQFPEKEASKPAIRGILMHEAIAEGMSETEFTEYEQWCIEFCKNTEDQLTKEYFGDKTPTICREIALDLHLPSGETIKDFGHPDSIAHVPGRALVKDWKFGFIKVEHAKSNPQLRAYAVMVADAFLSHEAVALAIVQPTARKEDRVSIVVYTADDIEQARREIAAYLDACEKPDAPLRPSLDACRYCRAKAACPALEKEEMAIQTVDLNQITTSNAADFYRRCKIVEMKVGAIKSRVRFVVETGEAEGRFSPGIRVKPGAKRRVITDAAKAYRSFADVVAPEVFMPCCTVKIGEAEEIFKKAAGLKGKAAKEAFELRLTQAGCLELKQNESSLELTEETNES